MIVVGASVLADALVYPNDRGARARSLLDEDVSPVHRSPEDSVVAWATRSSCRNSS
jgi:hypothetical protein